MTGLKKGVLTIALLLASAMPARITAQEELEGRWAGAIQFPGGSGSLEIVVTFSVQADVSATLEVPSQGAQGVVLTDVNYSAPAVEFVMATGAGPGEFRGKVDDDVIDGTFTQSGTEMTFRLERGKEASGLPAPAQLLAEAPEGIPALYVGHDSVDGARIQPYEMDFTLVRHTESGTESPFGRWTDKVELTTIAGIRVLRREVARFTAQDEMDLWRVHTTDPKTMEPIITDQRFGPELRSLVRVEQKGATLERTMLVQPDQSASVHTTTLSETPFDLSLYAVLLMSFPREIGYEASFPVTGPTGTLGWETYSVEDGGMIELPNGKTVSTQKVSTRFRNWSVWFEENAPYIVRVVQNMPDGSRIVSERAR
jgi:hypothetical protein